jgi:ribose transport system ATP-binding protein
MNSHDEIIKIEKVSKAFPGVQALEDVSFNVKTGEIHGLVGENGAGKSTLIKLIMGAYQPDKGKILVKSFDNNWAVPRNALEAKKLGMYANYQNVNIASSLTIGENYFLGQMPIKKIGVVDWKYVYEASNKILNQFNLKVSAKAKIKDLSMAEKEMVTVSKISVIPNLRIAIFDEPTALLDNDDVKILFDFIKQLKSNGVSIIYISHRLEEVMELCDRVTVLKDGRYITTKNVSEVNKDILISLMVGRAVGELYDIEHHEPGEELMKIVDLSSKNKFSGISFELKSGEILGFFGLIGSGRTEVMRSIYGVDKFDSGKIYIKGKGVKIKNPGDALAKNLGFSPEDRRKEGLALKMPIYANINMSSYSMISKFGVIDTKKEAARALYFMEKLNIKSSLIQKVMNLSGGTQQKVVIGKLLCRNADIFIFDEPTEGVDVGARKEIYKLIEQLAKEGKGIIVVSSYLPEVIGLSDRIVVMAEGKIVGEISRSEIDEKSEEKILKMASKFAYKE